MADEINEAVRELPEDIDFPAVMQLLNSKHAALVLDRHVKVVIKICRQCQNGFLLKHLPYLAELVETIAARWRTGTLEFAVPICEIAKIASLPFVSCAAEDLLQYGKWLPAFVNAVISVLGDALPLQGVTQTDSNESSPQELRQMMRIEIAHMISEIARYGLEDPWVQEGPCDSIIENVSKLGTPSLRLLQQTSVIPEIAQAFRVEHSSEALVIMLGALKDMSLFQPLAVQITNNGLLSNLIAVIRNNLLGSDVLLVSAEILWNVLELDTEHASAALGNMDVLEGFVAFLMTVLYEGYRYKDKIFRNDMVALLYYIASKQQNHLNFANSGLLLLILKHAAEGSVKDTIAASGIFEEETESLEGISHSLFQARQINTDAPPTAEPIRKEAVPLTTSQEDMEFRILTWRSIAKTAVTPRCAALIEKFLFSTLLLGYLDVIGTGEPELWSLDQKRKLQLEAIGVLFLIVPHCPSSFIEADGNGIVIRLLQTTTDRDLRKACLTLLHAACLSSTRADGIEQVDVPPCCMLDESHIGIIQILLNIFQEEEAGFQLRQLACSILGGLCRQDDEYSAEFRKKGGVEIIAKEIKWNPHVSLQDRSFFTLYVIDSVWSAVVGDKKNELRFLRSGGLFSLLDALEIAPIMLRRHILGCIADLVQNKIAAQLFIQWNSATTMKGGLKILLEFWQEEQSIAESITPEGLVSDLDYPLNPKNNPIRRNNDAVNSSNAFSQTAKSETHNEASEAGYHHGGSAPSNGPATGMSGVSAIAKNTKEKTANDAMAKSQSIHALQNPASSTQLLDLAERVDQDSRPKIYAILSKIGFEGHETLTMDERQSLEILRLLPECLVLEQLKDIEYNLQDFKLLAQDQRWLDEMIVEQRTRAEWIKTVQTQLFEEHQTDEVATLQRYYDDIRNRMGREMPGEQ